MDLVGMVDMKNLVDNMDMVDNMKMVDNIGMLILQKYLGYLRINNVDLVKGDIVDIMAIVAIVDSNDKVYMLEKMDQVGKKRAIIGPNWP